MLRCPMNQRIDLAEARNRLSHCSLTVFGEGDVSGDRLVLVAVRLEARAHRVGVEVNRCNLIPCSEKMTGAGVANSARRTCYQDCHPRGHISPIFFVALCMT